MMVTLQQMLAKHGVVAGASNGSQITARSLCSNRDQGPTGYRRRRRVFFGQRITAALANVNLLPIASYRDGRIEFRS